MTNYVKAVDFAAKDTLVSGDPNKIIKGTEINTELVNIQTAINTKANINSPEFTGTPLTTTAAAGTNTTQIASTAYVMAERSNTATLTNKTLTSPTINTPTISGGSVSGITDLAVADGGTGASTAANARTNLGLVIGTDVAPVASPAFTGTPTAPTAAFGTNTTQIASTAFVQAVAQAMYPVGSVYISTTVTNPSSIFGFGTWVAFGAGRVLVGQDTSDSSFDTLEETGGSKDAIVVSHTHTGTTASSGTHNHATSANGNTLGYQTSGSDVYNVVRSSLDQGPFNNMVTGSGGAHTHDVTINSTGSTGTNANLQPYVVVKMWKRTA